MSTPASSDPGDGGDSTPETLRTGLQALAARLGKTPTVVEMHKQGNFHPEQYVDAFGSWDDALEVAGLDPDESKNQISEIELLAELQRLAQELGHSPTQEDMKEHGKYADNTYKLRFGTWNNALQEAMLDTNDISEKDLLRELERVADELGRVPTAAEMAEHGEHAPATYHRRFGSWMNALVEADFSNVEL
ncbi:MULTISPECIES: homing endonuclease associated repeat-containing protein [Halorussus]|uniref:homing endonuclease associated repeat-containing protein n=1 Tax=Halorussus TaxID=1070314 RepID=UPI00209EE5DC|nr:hypothetical protein [Halorussus vallis]USZ78625.1 hypothetical protein NGM07_25080 [Halorussus vallis]